MKAPLEPVRWQDGAVRILDQRQLPERLVHLECREVPEVAEAIRTLAVRGAPAIGIAAGYGVALAAFRARERGAPVEAAVLEAAADLETTRPTAVNLFYALRRMRAVTGSRPEAYLEEAHRILEEDLATGLRIAEAGLTLFPGKPSVSVMTHCNAGGLATGGWGTALAPVYLARETGRDVRVYADETRPLLQGSRLTAWELTHAGIPVTVMVDGAGASVLRRGSVDLVIVGADRVAANGDTANKIGTYAVALAAREAGVPFYVAAPLSTFDFELPSGDRIPIEERAPEEVLGDRGARGAEAVNPAFDVTPAGLIAGWITERGILRPPFEVGMET